MNSFLKLHYFGSFSQRSYAARADMSISFCELFALVRDATAADGRPVEFSELLKKLFDLVCGTHVGTLNFSPLIQKVESRRFSKVGDRRGPRCLRD